MQKKTDLCSSLIFLSNQTDHIHRMSNISTLNCPPAVYWWRTTETLVYGLPDLLSRKKNQPPFLKATIFLTSLVGLSWKRQLEHLLTKLPQNPTSAHIGPGKKHLLTWPQNPTSAAFHLLSSQTASSTRCLASTTSEYINIKSLFGSLQM